MPRLTDPIERPRQIFTAVYHLILHGGMEAVTLRGVARVAGLSLSSVRHHYPTKEYLLACSVWDCVEVLRATARRVYDEYAGRVDEHEYALQLLLSQLPSSDHLRETCTVWLEFEAWGRYCAQFAQPRREAGWHADHVHAIACRQVGVVDEAISAEGRRLSALMQGLRAQMCDTIEPLELPEATAVLRGHLGSLSRAAGAGG